MNAAARIATPVEVLARLDTHKREPVVFLRSTIDSKGNIKLWRNGQEEKSHVDFYGTTIPLSGKDEKVVVQRFAEAYGIKPEEVNINRRLPRTPRDRASVVRNLPAPQPQAAPAALAAGVPPLDPAAVAALLAAFPQLQGLLPAGVTPAPEAATNGSAAPALTLVHDANAQQAAAATEQQAAQQPEDQPAGTINNSSARKRMTKAEKKRARSEAAKKAAATRAANRAGTAKPLDSQPLPQGPQGDLPQAGEKPAPMPQGVDKIAPVVQATPDQVAAQVAKLREQFNSQLDAILGTLTPATQK